MRCFGVVRVKYATKLLTAKRKQKKKNFLGAVTSRVV